MKKKSISQADKALILSLKAKSDKLRIKYHSQTDDIIAEVQHTLGLKDEGWLFDWLMNDYSTFDKVMENLGIKVRKK